MRAKLANEIRKTLPDVLPDLSNFDRALVRWKNRINSERTDRADEILDWLMQPNANHMWEDFVKIWVNDLLVQGNSAIYIEVEDNRPENLYVMPSGTTLPIKTQRSSIRRILPIRPRLRAAVVLQGRSELFDVLPHVHKSTASAGSTRW
jgi:hypothetical protein